MMYLYLHKQRNGQRKLEKTPGWLSLYWKKATKVLRYRTNVLIVEHKLGFVCANAGIDHSNVLGESGDPEEWMLLLPKDPDASRKKNSIND